MIALTGKHHLYMPNALHECSHTHVMLVRIGRASACSMTYSRYTLTSASCLGCCLLCIPGVGQHDMHHCILSGHSLPESLLCQAALSSAVPFCRGERRWKGSTDSLTGLRQRRVNRSNSDLAAFGVRETKRSQSEHQSLATCSWMHP